MAIGRSGMTKELFGNRTKKMSHGGVVAPGDGGKERGYPCHEEGWRGKEYSQPCHDQQLPKEAIADVQDCNWRTAVCSWKHQY